MPNFYFVSFFFLLFNFAVTKSEPNSNIGSNNLRELAFNFYGSKYGSPVFPITYYGNDFYVVKVPISMGEPHVPLVIMPYSSQTWFSSIKNAPLDRVIVKCDLKTEDLEAKYISYSGSGKKCHLSYGINSGQSLEYIFLYFFTTDYTPKGIAAGGLGLGISKESFPTAIGGRGETMHSIYLSTNQEAYSHILFGGQDPRFYTGNCLGNLQAVDVGTWAFLTTGFDMKLDNSKRNFFALNNNVILDPNYPNIHFPNYLMDQMINFMTGMTGSKCSYNNYEMMISCGCEELKKLEYLKFTFGDNVDSFATIPKEAILLIKENKECLLRISGTAVKDVKYHSVSQKFEKYIIFGSVFMNYFYTVFRYDKEATRGNMELYLAIPNVQRPPHDQEMVDNSSNRGWFTDIVLAGVFVLTLWAIYHFLDFIYQRYKKREASMPPPLRIVSELTSARQISEGSQSDREKEHKEGDSFHFAQEDEDEF